MHQNVTSLAAAQQKNSLMFVGLQRIYIIHPLTGGETHVFSSKTGLRVIIIWLFACISWWKPHGRLLGWKFYFVCVTVELVFLCVHESLKVSRGKTMQSPNKMPESTNTSCPLFFSLLFDVARKRKISGKAQNSFCCRLIWVLTHLPLPSTETATMIHPSFPSLCVFLLWAIVNGCCCISVDSVTPVPEITV